VRNSNFLACDRLAPLIDQAQHRGLVMRSSSASRCDCSKATRWIWICLVLLFLAVFALSSPPWATAGEATDVVDFELVIAVDVSTSMDQEEQRLQREGYVRALRSPEVMQAIKSGRRGRIAVIYIEWASPENQRVLVVNV
jgi:hypothetical protein